MAARINVQDSYLGSCMFAIVQFDKTIEDRQATWRNCTPLGTHKSNQIFPLKEQDTDMLREEKFYKNCRKITSVRLDCAGPNNQGDGK